MEAARAGRVLGIDPGTLRMGFAVLDGERGAPRLVESGVLEAPASATPARRLGQLFRALLVVVERTAPECMAIESSFFGKNALSMLRLGEARGCALAVAGSRDLPAFDYPPARVKKSVTGNGNATKSQVARALVALLPGMTPVAELAWLDQSDAIAVAWCHLEAAELARRHARVDAAVAAAALRNAPRSADAGSRASLPRGGTKQAAFPGRSGGRAGDSVLDVTAAVARWQSKRRR